MAATFFSKMIAKEFDRKALVRANLALIISKFHTLSSRNFREFRRDSNGKTMNKSPTAFAHITYQYLGYRVRLNLQGWLCSKTSTQLPLFESKNQTNKSSFVCFIYFRSNIPVQIMANIPLHRSLNRDVALHSYFRVRNVQ